ncbi:hypothetical protein Ahy_A01g001403 isoform C [Arachis hypogaea]|uniref:Transposase MuDR plant domain-containing protein n=1 Tax=Arachis hypogaea TaxID=3818 RepID=A0A445EN62_ARAHY|nr:hypothetical protein Ahy_A01g001403 isoform C [Arachis hypogaea]
MDDEGQQLVVYGGEHAGLKHAKPAADIFGAENSKSGDDVNLETDMEEETKEDLNFTNSEDELDPDVSGFQDVNVVNEKSRAVKKNGVTTDNFGEEDVVRSDDYRMTTRLEGLLPAYDEVIPGVENRFCVRHLYSNFRKRFPGLQLKQLMWRCAKATHWRDWERNMAELKVVNQEAYKYLNAIPPRYWSRSRFTYNSKVDTLVNHMSESFNAAIVDAREKPILTILEEIRVKLMIRWAENRDLAQNHAGTILPRIRIKLERRSRSAGE